MRTLTLFLCFAAATCFLHAVDVSPSRQTVPKKHYDPGGKRFSIFAGDPERIKRANKVDVKSFESTLKVTPDTFSKATQAEKLAEPTLKISFSVRNKGKKTYTLSFPNSQRFDIAITDKEGNVVYLWSEDKIFTEDIGASMLNPEDHISFRENVPLGHFENGAKPGEYTVNAVLHNYPEIIAKAPLVIAP